VSQAALLLRFFEVRQNFGRISPAAFTKEVAPDGDVLIGKLSSDGKTPLQNLLVGAALKHARNKGVIRHAEIAQATPVEAFAKPRCVIGGKLAPSMNADFIKHARKPDHAFCSFVRATRKS